MLCNMILKIAKKVVNLHITFSGHAIFGMSLVAWPVRVAPFFYPSTYLGK